MSTDDTRGRPVARMSPLGRRIMATKRQRIAATIAGHRAKVWGLTLALNVLVRRADK